MSRTLIGIGTLNWDKGERISDRYGSLNLWMDGDAIRLPHIETGAYGQLQAVVIETRESKHIGDLFRGIRPSTPNIGDQFTLGEGTLFYTDSAGITGTNVGLMPPDGRTSDWLDPHQLYKVHEQTVELFFVTET